MWGLQLKPFILIATFYGIVAFVSTGVLFANFDAGKLHFQPITPETVQQQNQNPPTTPKTSDLELWGFWNLNGNVGTPFSATYTGRKGQPPYHFQLDSGVGFPPHGVVLDANGKLSGTPTARGTSHFRVCVVDVSGTQNCADATMVVAAALPPPVAPPPPPAEVTPKFVYTAASCVLTSNDGQTKVFTITASGTVTGPVGTYFQLPYINGFFSQRTYTGQWGGGGQSGSRGANDPETSNWTFNDVERNTQTSTSVDATVTLGGQAGQEWVTKDINCPGAP
jgi:hypothetical protein